MTVSTGKIPVSAFTCPGCTCGACVSNAIKDIEKLDGVVHVRLDRSRRQFVVRFDGERLELEQILAPIRRQKVPMIESSITIET